MNVVASLPRLLRRLVVAAVRLMPRNSRLADVVASFGQRRVDEYWQLVERRILFQRQLVDKWAARRLDILITPGIGIPAFRHGASRDLSPACSHTFLFNLVNFPAGAVPVSRVRPDECSYTCPARQDDMAAAAARREMAGAAGLPVGVQVVGLPLHEERVLRGMRQLEAALRRRSTNTDTAATAAPPAAKSASADTGGRNAAGGGDLLPPAHCGYCPEAVVQATLAQLTRGATRLQ